jgi:hypothetical protein
MHCCGRHIQYAMVWGANGSVDRTQTVDADVPPQIGYVLIHHYSSPNDGTADVQLWLTRLGTALPPISEVMKVPSETTACKSPSEID